MSVSPRPSAERSLARRLRDMIAAEGPIALSRYMDLCLNDPEAGYYATRRPVGADGDFTTAPEISQMFGELLAVWCIAAWGAMERPDAIVLAEIGPGRGTLMADMLRTARSQPPFAAAVRPHLVETSATLRAQQRAAVGDSATWHESVDDLPAGPALVVANELLDALPFEQYRHDDGWRQQMVDVRVGRLCRVDGPPVRLEREGEPGEIVEVSPAREAMVRMVAERVARHGGASLWIDYGSLEGGTGDTFQAVRGHRRADPFERPGEADLTSHVDFAALRSVAEAAGCAVQATTQGQFLLRMGLLERAEALGVRADDASREALRMAVERLAAPSAMGELFKVMALRHPALPPLPGFGDSP